MGKWRIEGSDDSNKWTEIVSLNGAELAQSVFDFELVKGTFAWVRLVSPEGRVEERARTGE